MSDVVAVVAVAVLFGLAGWMLSRCAPDLTPAPAPTTTTTDYRDAPVGTSRP